MASSAAPGGVLFVRTPALWSVAGTKLAKTVQMHASQKSLLAVGSPAQSRVCAVVVEGSTAVLILHYMCRASGLGSGFTSWKQGRCVIGT